MRRFFSLCLVALASGCGLTLDYDPQPPRIDGGGMRMDGGQRRDGAPPGCSAADCADDGDPWNGTERCDLATGQCAHDNPLECRGRACEDAECVPGQGCVTSPRDCPGTGCARQICNPLTDACEPAPDISACGPVVACLQPICTDAGCDVIDRCAERGGTCNTSDGLCRFPDCSSSCSPQPPCITDANCSDGGVCNLTFAGPGTGCMAGPCEPGFCDGSGHCLPSLRPISCTPDPNPCRVAVCTRLEGCHSEDRPDGTDCDLDDNLCTTDKCVGGHCTATADTLGCVDPDPLDCTIPQCNPTTGGCDILLTRDSGMCDDRLGCTSNDVCAAGICIGISGCADNMQCVFGGFCDCLAGFSDCNGNDLDGCECMGPCGASGRCFFTGIDCSGVACTPEEFCCASLGRCIPNETVCPIMAM